MYIICRYHLMPEHRGSLTSYRTSHRQPEGTKPYLFAIGGGSLFAIHAECEVSIHYQHYLLTIYSLSTPSTRCTTRGRTGGASSPA